MTKEENRPDLTLRDAIAQAKFPRLNPSNVAAVIAVASGKGGVGKSTIAANLAVALAARGKRVALLDADIYGPSAPALFNINEQPAVNSAGKISPIVRHGVSVMSIGMLIDPDKALIWRGPMVHTALTQLFRDVDWGTQDLMILDMPPGTGDAALTIVRQVEMQGAVIVSTPQDLALRDARRAITMFKQTSVPILGLIENMSAFTCVKCGHTSNPFNHGGAEAEAVRQDVPFLGHVPLDAGLMQASENGLPLAIGAPDNALVGLFADISKSLDAKLLK